MLRWSPFKQEETGTAPWFSVQIAEVNVEFFTDYTGICKSAV